MTSETPSLPIELLGALEALVKESTQFGIELAATETEGLCECSTKKIQAQKMFLLSKNPWDHEDDPLYHKIEDLFRRALKEAYEEGYRDGRTTFED